MAHDREVLRMIWEGQIGICFQADRDEIVGIKPEPFYLMISRLSYLPLVTDKVNNWNIWTIFDNPDNPHVLFGFRAGSQVLL